MAERSQTALGVARARFVDGLPKKARELRGSLALLAGAPDGARTRDELRRKLHALYASAQVFRIRALVEAVKDSLDLIDDVRLDARPFTQDELDGLANLVATIPALGRGGETADPSGPRASRPPAPSRPSHPPRPDPELSPTVDTVVSVLVIDTPKSQALVRAALPPDRFELVVADNAEEGLRLARSGQPDVVLADRAAVLERGIDLIGCLRDDPLTDFVPVVLLLPPGSTLDPIAVREAGADEALLKPFDALKLRRTVHRVVATLGGPRGASTLTGDLTVEQIADRIADEVRRGLVDAAAKGRDVLVPLGDGTPLLAATWSAIGRVRAHLAERSGGRVHFRESPGRGGPSFISVVGEPAPPEDGEPVDLAGRRVLVVDDDPAVVWFFAGLLREHGAVAIEAGDGVEALERARGGRPDLVISDILMPRLDGFGLTRALKRDPMLADVPVILLSWKEDFLQRMRQLKAGASGYLRKEAGSGQILAAIRDALRPRAWLESRLDAGGDVRGRLEDLGVPVLLQTVSRRRPDARVTVRDPASLYEVDLRGGELVDITRTARDGDFARGEQVLVGLIGSTTGRYTVVDAQGAARRSIERPLEDVMRDAITELAARVDAVSGRNLAKAAHVELDEDVLRGIMASSPEELDRLVRPLRAGRGPRELLMSGELEPRVLEEFLVDLARQGAIREVLGPDDEDRIALAREARRRGLHPDISEHDRDGTLSWLPPAENGAEAPAQDASSDAVTLDLMAPGAETPDTETLNIAAPDSAAPDAEPLDIAAPDAETLDIAAPDAETLDIAAPDTTEDPPQRVAEMRDAATLELSAERAVPSAGGDDGLEAERRAEREQRSSSSEASSSEASDSEASDSEASDSEASDSEASDSEASDSEASDSEASDSEASDALSPEGEAAEESALEHQRSSELEEGPEPEAAAPSRELSVPPAPQLIDREDAPLPLPAPRLIDPADDRPAIEARPQPTDPDTAGDDVVDPARPMTDEADEADGSRWIAWALVALVLVVVGYLGMRVLMPPAVEQPHTIGPLPPTPEAPSAPDVAPAASPEATPPARPDSPTVTTPEPAPRDPSLPAAYGREEPTIRSVGVDVPDGQGLLLIEPAADDTPLDVELDGQSHLVRGRALALALPPGVHHLTLSRGDRTDFLWASVSAGRTRVIPPPP